MAKHVLLNNVEHADLRVVTTRSADLGDDVMYAVTFPWEFRNLQAHYPILFRKRSDTGEFQPIALFGFEERENLFLSASGWDAAYVPLTVERQPFLIGMQPAGSGGSSESQPVIHVDLDSPRISRTSGEAVFLDHGGVSAYLERITSVLHTIHRGLEATPAFIESLLECDLLESFVLDVQLQDGSEHRLAGFYTLNEERLRELDGAALGRLNSRGYLQPIYMVIASLSHFRDLIDRRNRRLER
jgi:SapC